MMASHSVSRTVLDPSGAVFPKAQVTLSALDGWRLGGAQTDHTGSFHFDKLNQRTYEVFVRASDFKMRKPS